MSDGRPCVAESWPSQAEDSGALSWETGSRTEQTHYSGNLGRGGVGEGACIQPWNKAPVPVTLTGSHQGTVGAYSLLACCGGLGRNVLFTPGLDSATYDLQELGQMI